MVDGKWIKDCERRQKKLARENEGRSMELQPSKSRAKRSSPIAEKSLKKRRQRQGSFSTDLFN
jgi:hypothetical protein